MRRLHGTTDSMVLNLSKLQEVVEDRGACCVGVHGLTKSQTLRPNNNKNVTTSLSVLLKLKALKLEALMKRKYVYLIFLHHKQLIN